MIWNNQRGWSPSPLQLGDKTMAAITLYMHVNGTGASLTLIGDDPNLVDYGWNDVASSVNVQSGIWTLYEHVDYGGAPLTLGPGFYNLTDFGWNDVASSVDWYL
jgi:hypothetical protein